MWSGFNKCLRLQSVRAECRESFFAPTKGTGEETLFYFGDQLDNMSMLLNHCGPKVAERGG